MSFPCPGYYHFVIERKNSPRWGQTSCFNTPTVVHDHVKRKRSSSSVVKNKSELMQMVSQGTKKKYFSVFYWEPIVLWSCRLIIPSFLELVGHKCSVAAGLQEQFFFLHWCNFFADMIMRKCLCECALSLYRSQNSLCLGRDLGKDANCFMAWYMGKLLCGPLNSNVY